MLAKGQLVLSDRLLGEGLTAGSSSAKRLRRFDGLRIWEAREQPARQRLDDQPDHQE
jgi:hypothetical protein